MGEWPNSIREIIKRQEGRITLGTDVDLQSGVRDVSSEATDLIEKFRPDIELPRRHLLRRTRDNVLVRALLNKDANKMCLQYLYVFPFRIGILSHVWNLVVPLTMIGWASVVIGLFSSGILPSPFDWLPLIVTAITLSPLPILGFEPHLKDYFVHPSGSRQNVRPTSWLVLYYTMTLFLVFVWIRSRIWTDLAFVTAVILVGVVYAIFNLRGRRHSAMHELEYLPVILWLEKKNDEWELKRGCWPYYGKRTVNMARRVLKSSPFRFRGHVFYRPEWLGNGRRLRFYIDNTWNSIQLGSRGRVTQYQSVSSILMILVFLAILAVNLGLLMVTGLVSIITIVVFLMVMSLVIIVDLPTILQNVIEEQTMMPLTNEKLANLWNLSDKARLGFIWKLQYPFFKKNLYFRSLDDSMARVVIDSYISGRERKRREGNSKEKEEREMHDYMRVLVHGHTTPQLGMEIALRDDDSNDNDDYPNDVNGPVTFRLTLTMNLGRLTRLLSVRNDRSINEGDIYETPSVGSLLGYIRQYIENPSEGDTTIPASGVKFAKVTKRIRSEFLARQQAIMEIPTADGVFRQEWKVSAVEETSGQEETSEREGP